MPSQSFAGLAEDWSVGGHRFEEEASWNVAKNGPTEESNPTVKRFGGVAEALSEGSHPFEEEAFWNLIKNGPTEESNPPVRQVLVVSQHAQPAAYEYVLQLVAGIPASKSKDRLVLSLGGRSPGASLTEKILNRPDVLDQLRRVMAGSDQADLHCYMNTKGESVLAHVLGANLQATDPALQYWGSKPGGRELLQAAGVPVSPGTQTAWSVRGLAEEIAALAESDSKPGRWVVKLSNGVSGGGQWKAGSFESGGSHFRRRD